jgi:hypothetical protein
MTTPGSTTARGYGSSHQKERARWAPIVADGEAFCTEPVCLMPTRWIRPGTAWDLAHTPDRSAYRGPSHALCNRSEGSRRGNRRRAGKPSRRVLGSGWQTSRQW